MSESLIKVREDKHQEINGGTYPLTNSAYSSIDDLLRMGQESFPMSLDPLLLDSKFEIIHGRISNFRKSGGISFIKLTDGSGSMQVIATKAVLVDYGNLHLLDLGDIIEVEGKLCSSKTNEKSLLLTKWKVLTKSHLPPPEKFAGIADSEIKYRQRYLDLMSSEESRAIFITRSLVIRAIRNYMECNGFMEVETSTLNTVSSGAAAKPFTTYHNSLGTNLFLRIAPELYLKKLLVGGFEKIYEIGRNYRNEGISTRHNPEFTMMEFYEAYATFPKLIDYTIELFAHVEEYIKEYCECNSSDFIIPFIKKWKERSYSLSEYKLVTMKEAVEAGLAKADHLVVTNERYSKIDIKGLNHKLTQVKNDGERLGVLFEYVAEPFLTEDYRTDDDKSAMVFITEFPSEICPLARQNDNNHSVCDRFELYVDGKELCNAFQELNDPAKQLEKFNEQGGADLDYVEALKYGMPPAIGWGIGLDRLIMLLTNASSIKDVILFPTLKPNPV